jgi:penicillin-binding protein 2
MQRVVEAGTGKIAQIPGIDVCGKTGTAQNERFINGKKIKLQNHSMFVAFAPRDTPRIAVAVCIENSGYGATWAGPIASLMIEQYLKDTIAPKRQGLLKKMQTAKIIPNYIYLLDSLEKQKARERELLKRAPTDSMKRVQALKDSLKRRQDSVAVMNYIRRTYMRKPTKPN